MVIKVVNPTHGEVIVGLVTEADALQGESSLSCLLVGVFAGWLLILLWLLHRCRECILA